MTIVPVWSSLPNPNIIECFIIIFLYWNRKSMNKILSVQVRTVCLFINFLPIYSIILTFNYPAFRMAASRSISIRFDWVRKWNYLMVFEFKTNPWVFFVICVEASINGVLYKFCIKWHKRMQNYFNLLHSLTK